MAPVQRLQKIHPKLSDIADDNLRRVFAQLTQRIVRRGETLEIDTGVVVSFQHPADGTVVVKNPE